MREKFTDIIPIIGMFNVVRRANRESHIEGNRARLEELNMYEYTITNLKSIAYTAALGIYNCAR
jgi:hypothetical protein